MTDENKEYTEFTRKLFETVGRLDQQFHNDNDIKELYNVIEIFKANRDDDYTLRKCVNTFQRVNDKLFERYGVCDEIIDFQLLINILRHRLDVTDPKEVVVVDNEKEFVQ